MRVALCFSGGIRTGIEASKNIKRFLGDLEPDVFIHTWDVDTFACTAQYPSTDILPAATFPINVSDLAKLKAIYKPKTVKVDVQSDIFQSNRHIHNKLFIHFGHPMIYSIQQANLLKTKFENDNGFKYDIVIRARFDCIFPMDAVNILKDIHLRPDFKDTIYCASISNKEQWGLLEDVFWVGSSDNMNVIADFWDVWENETAITFGYQWWWSAWQIKMFDLLKSKNINVVAICPFSIYRAHHAENNIDPLDDSQFQWHTTDKITLNTWMAIRKNNEQT